MSNTNWAWTPKVVTPKDIYGDEWEDMPILAGSEILGFDTPKRGQVYLNTVSGKPCECLFGDSVEPRLIIRKKQPRRWVFEECSKEEGLESFGMMAVMGTRFLIPEWKTKAVVSKYADFIHVRAVEEK